MKKLIGISILLLTFSGCLGIGSTIFWIAGGVEVAECIYDAATSDTEPTEPIEQRR